MSDEKFMREWLRRYRCPWCRRHGDPAKCGMRITERHEGFRCHGYRCDFEKTTAEAMGGTA